MKFSLVVACLAGALLVANVNSQLLPPFMPPLVPGLMPPILPPLLPGLLPPFLFPGLLPPLFPPLLGLPLMRPFFGLRRFIGKRDINGKMVEVIDDSTVSNRTLCTYSSQKSVLSCHGFAHNFDCDVKEHLTALNNTRLRLADLEVIPTTEGSFDLFKIVSRKSNGKFTVIEPIFKKELVLSIFNSEKITEPGLLVEDDKCWSLVQDMVRESRREDIRLALFI